MIELLLLAAEFSMDPQRLLVDVLALAELRGGDPEVFLTAASYMTVDMKGKVALAIKRAGRPSRASDPTLESETAFRLPPPDPILNELSQ